jgi:hypothetical protein
MKSLLTFASLFRNNFCSKTSEFMKRKSEKLTLTGPVTKKFVKFVDHKLKVLQNLHESEELKKLLNTSYCEPPYNKLMCLNIKEISEQKFSIVSFRHASFTRELSRFIFSSTRLLIADCCAALRNVQL